MYMYIYVGYLDLDVYVMIDILSNETINISVLFLIVTYVRAYKTGKSGHGSVQM